MILKCSVPNHYCWHININTDNTIFIQYTCISNNESDKMHATVIITKIIARPYRHERQVIFYGHEVGLIKRKLHPIIDI